MRGLHFVERGIADFPDICIVQGDRDASPAREKDPDRITVRVTKELRKDVRAWIASADNNFHAAASTMAKRLNRCPGILIKLHGSCLEAD